MPRSEDRETSLYFNKSDACAIPFFRQRKRTAAKKVGYNLDSVVISRYSIEYFQLTNVGIKLSKNPLPRVGTRNKVNKKRREAPKLKTHILSTVVPVPTFYTPIFLAVFRTPP